MTEAPPLDLQVDGYLAYLAVERNLAANTLDAYGRDLADLTSWLVGSGITDARDVGGADLSAWVRHLATGRAAKSQARMLIAARGLFRYLVREEVIDADPTAWVPLPRLGRPLPDPVSFAEVTGLLAAAEASPRDQALIALLYGAGLRISEALGLDMAGVDLDGGLVRVLGKGDKERVVPIPEVVINLLQRYLDTDRPLRLKGRQSEVLFPGRGGRGRLTRQAAFAMLRRRGRAAGLARDISPHKLRHGFATHLVQGGADLRSVQTMLGHTDLRTTEVYTHIDPGHLRRSYEAHHPRS